MPSDSSLVGTYTSSSLTAPVTAGLAPSAAGIDLYLNLVIIQATSTITPKEVILQWDNGNPLTLLVNPSAHIALAFNNAHLPDGQAVAVNVPTVAVGTIHVNILATEQRQGNQGAF